MQLAAKRGFSLIELLTVIGIIALLAAILMPVFSRAREQARQTACISNLHDMYVAASQYRQDYEDYPPVLLGLPENPDGSYWQQGNAAPVDAGRIRRGFLYPAYVRNIEKFHCPDNTTTDQRAIVNAVFPPNAGFSGYATFSSHGLDVGAPTTPLPYYAYDSYDISTVLGQSGAYTVVYSRDWTNAEGRGLDPATDEPYQLKYPNPPLDQTILAWCNYHVRAGSDKCPLILASGTARTAYWKDIQAKSWSWAAR